MLCAYSTRRACELLVAGGNIKAGAPAHWARCVMCGAVHPRMLADVAMLRCCRPPPTEKKGWNTLGHNMQLSFEERPTQPPNHPPTHSDMRVSNLCCAYILDIMLRITLILSITHFEWQHWQEVVLFICARIRVFLAASAPQHIRKQSIILKEIICK